MARLTKRSIDALEPRGSDYFVWDDEIKGFGVRVLPSGRKTFVAQYRSGGVQRRVKLGIYGAVTADQARIRARQTLGEVAGGGNPSEIRESQRLTTRGQALPLFVPGIVTRMGRNPALLGKAGVRVPAKAGSRARPGEAVGEDGGALKHWNSAP